MSPGHHPDRSAEYVKLVKRALQVLGADEQSTADRRYLSCLGHLSQVLPRDQSAIVNDDMASLEDLSNRSPVHRKLLKVRVAVLLKPGSPTIETAAHEVGDAPSNRLVGRVFEALKSTKFRESKCAVVLVDGGWVLHEETRRNSRDENLEAPNRLGKQRVAHDHRSTWTLRGTVKTLNKCAEVMAVILEEWKQDLWAECDLDELCAGDIRTEESPIGSRRISQRAFHPPIDVSTSNTSSCL